METIREIPVKRVVAALVVALACCLGAFGKPVSPAYLSGVVQSGPGGAPVVGATVTVNGHSTLSVAGGVYMIAVDPPGTYSVTCTKAGFDGYTSAPVTFQPGIAVTLPIMIWESLNPVTGTAVSIDTSLMQVPVSWEVPAGPYEMVYDDGLQDNFTVWALSGNLNAVRFTPSGYPVNVTGGSLHIGMQSNYPAGSNPLVPFSVSVYDASGPGGAPGSQLAGPFAVTPLATGWVGFTFPSPVAIAGGSFYLVMIQGGNAPNASGIAIDETTPQFRSWSRFATGGGPWFPAGGNLMMRALCNGPGGPAMLGDSPLQALDYAVYRLRQGEEQNPSIWTSLGISAHSPFSDTAWPQLPCGPWRWGVRARYPGNRMAAAGFSNVIGKCWTAPVSLHIQLSCTTADPVQTWVRLENQVYPDTVYQGIPDTAGLITFPDVWKGTYHLTVTRYGYDTLSEVIPVAGPVARDLTLLQVRIPPANLTVSDSSLMARWDVPHFENRIFNETWSSGSLSFNGWTADAGGNWSVAASSGNPAPSAVFTGIPVLTAYARSLTSRVIEGQHSTLLKLRYDIFLDNSGTTNMNKMAVEIWSGSSWALLHEYSNQDGNLPWTSADIDISSYTDLAFKLRFRAYGDDSSDLNEWCVDNISVTGSEPAQVQANCIIGYYFYLGNTIIGYTDKNAFPIPGNLVQFGQTYTACVRALYGSGYSDFSCTSFVSHYLDPVRNISGNAVENTAWINWQKPILAGDTSGTVPPGLIGYTVLRNGSPIAVIGDPDTLSFVDYGLEPGYYLYGVTARYDLTPYGYPGQVGESLPDGPLNILINWGRQLPFYEPWSSGTFSYNDWRLVPSPGNWTVDIGDGLPAPTASFRWQPPAVNYSYSLESPVLNALQFNCAAIWLDFDLRLNDRNATGMEKLYVEAYYNNEWHRKAEISSTGNIPWTSWHIDISAARGKGFRVRFLAEGNNSSDILHWSVDNVNVYPECYPAADLEAEAFGYDIRLTWRPPLCSGGNLLNEGFEEPEFPPSQWSVQTTNPAATWQQCSVNSLTGVHSGNNAAALNWDYNHQDEWIVAHNVLVSGDLKFWSYAFQGSLHQDHYYVKISTDGGASWTVLLDLSALPFYPATGGVNAWLTPYQVDLSPYEGETVDLAWNAVDGDGNGLWYPWAIDDCSIGSSDNPRQILGYDIYRQSPFSSEYQKANGATVSDTTWTDAGMSPGQYHYFVRTIFSECTNIPNSDTVMVDVITGVRPNSLNSFRIIPNPASDFVTLTSSSVFDQIELISPEGKKIRSWNPVSTLKYSLGLSGIPQGLYLMRVRFPEGYRTAKICILK